MDASSRSTTAFEDRLGSAGVTAQHDRVVAFPSRGSGAQRCADSCRPAMSWKVWLRYFQQSCPPEQLQGTQPDRIQTAQSGLLNFMITVQGITYSGKLERAWLEPQVPDRLRLQLGLRHLWMTIHQAHIEGWLLRAQAGPMGLVIGTNSPVWLTLDLQLVVEDQRLRLHPVGVDFRIPDDNWGIMPPQYVEAGLWSFLGERISERLTQGLAEQRVAIEQQIRDSSVALVKKIEEQVERIFQRTIAPGNWPMPLWQPRFRFYPEQVACSEKGISLTLGAWVAAMGLRDPQAPCYRYPVRKPQTTVETGPGLQLALSPTLLEAWCVLLHESQVARFHVFDLHAPQLRILGTRQFWQDCWPELQEPWVNEVCDVQFEISQPPQLVFKPSGTDDVAELWMRLPEFQLHLKANTVTGREISGLFACAFEQPINLQLQRTSYQTREVYVNLPRVSPPVLTFLSGEPIPSTQTLHKLSEQLTAGWYENFGRQPRRLKVSDLRWADIPVRFERLQTTHDQLIASWERPGLRLRNATDQVQQYRVRTTWSSWSPPYTLHPGEIHEFHPRHQLWWMGASATQTVYRLSLGEVFEWRSGGLVQLLPGEKSSRVLHVDASSSGRR
ncbi:MAG: hypothetical protein KatS3mg113_0117 [Planctomycetaceae bacterium]|nr:MAG: hypothetical protein KatS3mg113_0117 [Planctomycetaceae bacterium]